MTKVVLWGSLKKAAGGTTELELDVADVRELLDALDERYPKLRPQLKAGVSVSIDGTLVRDNLFVAIRPDSEVYVLPRMAGG